MDLSITGSRTWKPGDYRSNLAPTWCKGCFYFGLLNALCNVLSENQIDPTKCTIISGIGCSSRLPLYMNTFGMHTLHGRAIPVAVGARLTHPEIPVVVVGGDGDLFSIGIGHFVHGARKNVNMTVICLDNRMYAMTKNQASPTSAVGYHGSLTPYGKLSVPLNVLEFAISCETTFVSRTFAGNPDHMKEMINLAFAHQGFSLVEVIAPCRTFDKKMNFAFFKDRLIDINQELGHDPADKKAALARAALAFEYDTLPTVKIPIGVFWQERSLTFEENVANVKKQYSKKGKSGFDVLVDECRA